MQDVEATTLILKELKDLGIHISIDDFGSGFSSLLFLRQFPIDSLKIAQVLIKNLTTDDDSAAVVRAIIALAHSLNLRVIAEGVESEEQYRFLSEQGCDEFQGFLCSHAVSAQEMTELLMKNVGVPAKISSDGKNSDLLRHNGV
jgi:EAL domain-containing protein (putative c-di-GMP-specific phosphodiesterase class I)